MNGPRLVYDRDCGMYKFTIGRRVVCPVCNTGQAALLFWEPSPLKQGFWKFSPCSNECYWTFERGATYMKTGDTLPAFLAAAAVLSGWSDPWDPVRLINKAVRQAKVSKAPGGAE